MKQKHQASTYDPASLPWANQTRELQAKRLSIVVQISEIPSRIPYFECKISQLVSCGSSFEWPLDGDI